MICACSFVFPAGGCKKETDNRLRTRLAPSERNQNPEMPACCSDHHDWREACICTEDDDLYFAGHGIGECIFHAKHLIAKTTVKGFRILIEVCEKHPSPLDCAEPKAYIGRIRNLNKGVYLVVVKTKDHLLGRRMVFINKESSKKPWVNFERFHTERGPDRMGPIRLCN